MTDKLGADHPLMVEVIESHQDRLRVMELVEAERDELRAENERLRAAMEGLLKYMVAMNVYTDRALAVQDAESALYGDA